MGILAEVKAEQARARRAAVEELARRLGDAAPSLGGRYLIYGSAARGELRYDSDVDLLLDFPEGSARTRWLEVERHADRAVRLFSMAAALFEEDVFHADGLRAGQAELALMHAMQSAHTLLENTLIALIKMFGEELPNGPDWHRDLVERASLHVGKRPRSWMPVCARRSTKRAASDTGPCTTMKTSNTVSPRTRSTPRGCLQNG